MQSQFLNSEDDPISAALEPPEAETTAERTVRLYAEAEAKRVSEQIDERLQVEQERIRKQKGDVKLLLLGQAESGKSTLQKQFQLLYCPHSLEQERSSWRTVIYFNVVRSIRQILSALETLEDTVNNEFGNATDTTDDANSGTSRIETGPTAISLLRLRLSHLVSKDFALADRLSGGIKVSGSGKGGVYVRSGWQSRIIESAKASQQSSANENQSAQGIPYDPLVAEVACMLESSEDDIRELWDHSVVKGLIDKRDLYLDEWSEFFLRHISRVAAPDYLPTTGKPHDMFHDDILHARIQTMGVGEHNFNVSVHGKTVTWHLYDVGAVRGQRHWVPYFDDANAIIFLAPVSVFDQYLDHDPRINRFDDSLRFFTEICSNPLLKSVHLVLIFNKTDLLRAKLKRGVKVRKYIPSFGDRSNDYETATRYFLAHFRNVYRRNNENGRVLYTHFINVVDTKATQLIIGNVRDAIFRDYLHSAAVM